LIFDEIIVRKALRTAWSLETAVQWTSENPASGQCNVTAAVIYDIFGGEILRTRLLDVWHYYNRIDGNRCDLSDSQFTEPGALFEVPKSYDDEVSSREAAMKSIPQKEYDALKQGLLSKLKD